MNHGHLSKQEYTLAVWTADAPTEMIQIFDEVALTLVLEMFPNYSKISFKYKGGDEGGREGGREGERGRAGGEGR